MFAVQFNFKTQLVFIDKKLLSEILHLKCESKSKLLFVDAGWSKRFAGFSIWYYLRCFNIANLK